MFGRWLSDLAADLVTGLAGSTATTSTDPCTPQPSMPQPTYQMFKLSDFEGCVCDPRRTTCVCEPRDGSGG